MRTPDPTLNRTDTPSPPLVTELLLLSDGSVLADHLTPAMAAVLKAIGLVPDTRTQCDLVGALTSATEPEHRLVDALQVTRNLSANGPFISDSKKDP